MKLISKQIESKYGKKILFDEKLANYSWFNLGGASEVFFKPSNIEEDQPKKEGPFTTNLTFGFPNGITSPP